MCGNNSGNFLIFIITGGEDFDLDHSILSFPTGSEAGTRTCFTVTIIEDSYVENTEYFSVHVKLVDLNAWLMGVFYITIHIYDDDRKN